MPKPLNPMAPPYQPKIVSDEILDKVGGDALQGQMYLAPDLAEASTNDIAVRQLRTVHDERRTAFDAMLQALRTRDPEMTAAGHYYEIYKQADKFITQTVKNGDTANKSAMRQIEALNNDIVNRLELVETSRATEIRAYFRAIKKPNERMTLAYKVIDDFDKETMAALLNAQTFLTGFTDDEIAVLRNHHEGKHAADLVARRKAIEKALTINRTAFDQLLVAMDAIFPKAKVEEIAAKVTKARNIKSAIFSPASGFAS